MHARPSQLIPAALMARETRPPAEWLLAGAELWVLFFVSKHNKPTRRFVGRREIHPACKTPTSAVARSGSTLVFCCFCLEKCSAMNNTFICEQTNSGARTHLYGAFLHRVASSWICTRWLCYYLPCDFSACSHFYTPLIFLLLQ